ncbi:HdeD family acid-resistance protein [Halobacteria archaeon AArc-m2/3/4]|uniref:HdeD family acid-resistance protein n=1 Tax=Natronoglomus mannanivorans TaxID=2979990 RepID=A0ABT2QCL3_9EURY|nr:HdeD family acid-resistance protein [Halobacteria archaeon AArc-m2/3/4]
MNTTTDIRRDGDFRPNWRTLALTGGVIALVGLFAIAFPFVSGLSLAYALGALLVVSGIVHGVHAFSAGSWAGSFWQLALAIVGVVAGVFVLANPALGLVSLTLLIVAYLLVDGAAELWMSIRMAGRSGRGWIAASGAISVLLAVFLWAGFPADATWVVGLFVGVSLLATGLSMVFVAMAGRAIDEDVTPSATEPRGA